MNAIKQSLKNWWVFVLFGVLFIITGFVVMFNPEKSFIALTILFVALILADGITSLFYTITNWKYLDGRGWYLSGSVLSVVIGILLVSNMQAAELTLAFLVGFWLLFRSFFIIASSLQLKDYGFMNWGWMMVSGVLMMIFSFILLFNPVAGAGFAVAMAAVSFLFAGVGYIVLGLNIRKVKSGTIDAFNEFKESVKKAAAEG